MTRKAKPPIALYSALADATRCKIIAILADGPIPVHKLADAFSISRPAISRHLRVLKEAGLVVEVKKGRENLYTFRARKLDKAVDWLNTFLSSDRAMEDDLPESIGPAPVPAMPQPAPEPPVEEKVAAVTEAAGQTLMQEKPKPRAPKKDAQQPQPAVDPLSQMGFDF